MVIGIEPIAIALFPDDLTELIRLVRQEYHIAKANQDWLRAQRFDRLLRQLGDETPAA